MTAELIIELASFLEDAKRYGVVSTLEMQARFIHLHLHVLGTMSECSTCPAKIERAINQLSQKLYSFKNMDQENQIEKRHFAKKAQLVYFSAKHKHVKTELLSDKEIIEMLAENVNYANHFILAEGWEEEVKEHIDNTPYVEEPKEKISMDALMLAGVSSKEELENKISTANKKFLNRIARGVNIENFVQMTPEELRVAIVNTVE